MDRHQRVNLAMFQRTTARRGEVTFKVALVAVGRPGIGEIHSGAVTQVRQDTSMALISAITFRGISTDVGFGRAAPLPPRPEQPARAGIGDRSQRTEGAATAV